MNTARLRELLCEKPLTAADLRAAHEMLVKAPPAIAKLLILVILLDSSRAQRSQGSL